jgi:hypothetical protein
VICATQGVEARGNSVQQPEGDSSTREQRLPSAEFDVLEVEHRQNGRGNRESVGCEAQGWEEKYSATMSLEGRLETFRWPSSYHQFSCCFGVAFVIEGHGYGKVTLSPLIAGPSPIWGLASGPLISLPTTTWPKAKFHRNFSICPERRTAAGFRFAVSSSCHVTIRCLARSNEASHSDNKAHVGLDMGGSSSSLARICSLFLVNTESNSAQF